MKNKRLKKIEIIFRKIFNKVFKDTKETLDVKMSKLHKDDFIKRYQSYRIYNDFCKKCAKELTSEVITYDRKKWKEHYEQIRIKSNMKLEPYFSWEKEIKEELFKYNFKVIKSIPQTILNLNRLKYIQILQKQVITGEVGRKALENLLKKVNSKYAKMIARTETSKLQTQLIKERCKRLNVSYYIWLSAKDYRTRDSHRKMNGVLVEWTSKEEEKPFLDNGYGHAGEFINCRCYPKPVFDEKDLSKNGTFKVWDIKKKKIITKTRKKVLELLGIY